MTDPTSSLLPLSALDPEGQAFLDRIVAAARAYLNADIGFLAEFQDREHVIMHAKGRGGSVDRLNGVRSPLGESYCHRVATGDIPMVIDDARADPRVNTLPATIAFGVENYIGVPVSMAGGRVLGTLCCANFDNQRENRERDAEFMDFLASLIGAQLGHMHDTAEARRRRLDAVQAVLDAGGPRMVFQPIVSLDDGTIVGVEALARFDRQPQRPPDAWFSDAWAVGLGAQLELAAIRSALEQLPLLPDGAYLAVNASPATLAGDAIDALLAQAPADRLVIEITEHAVVDDYASVNAAVARLRARGVRIAIDDVGAGYSGLRHLLNIAPDIAKLDMSLTRDVCIDPVKQALAVAIVAFSQRTGLRVVGEGIETRQEAQALAAIGIGYGQGYLFARPGALPFADASAG